MTTTVLDIRRQAKLTRVLELITSGEAKSMSEALEIADVSRSSFYRWQKAGVFDEVLAQM